MNLIDDPEMADRAAEVLKAVGHPLRLRIIAMLCRREQNVTSLAQMLDVPQAIVSQHLRILRMRGLTGVTRQSGHAVYWIAEPHLRDMVKCVTGCVSGSEEEIG